MFDAIIFGLFGLIVGSFLNVLILRFGKRTLGGRSASFAERYGGRSACPSCGARIAWYDNIPLISWFLLRGRCRTCGSAISFQYPLVEAGTAIPFALIGLAPLSLFESLLALPITALLIAIAVYDLRTTYIPDAWAYTFIILASVSSLGFPPYSAAQLTNFLLSGVVTAAPLFFLWFVSKGRWMGFGDVKLALGMGFLLGPLSGFFALALAFVLGAFVSLAILLPLPAIVTFLGRWGIADLRPSQSYTMKSEVPFGPFLVVATLIIWSSNLYGSDILAWFVMM
jgi:prepilin signal peptidase PulO-like enzyme (type II secretory pathway)